MCTHTQQAQCTTWCLLSNAKSWHKNRTNNELAQLLQNRNTKAKIRSHIILMFQLKQAMATATPTASAIIEMYEKLARIVTRLSANGMLQQKEHKSVCMFSCLDHDVCVRIDRHELCVHNLVCVQHNNRVHGCAKSNIGCTAAPPMPPSSCHLAVTSNILLCCKSIWCEIMEFRCFSCASRVVSYFFE